MARTQTVRPSLVVGFRDVRASLGSVRVASNVEIARGIREKLFDGRSVKLLETSLVQRGDRDGDYSVLWEISLLKLTVSFLAFKYYRLGF